MSANCGMDGSKVINYKQLLDSAITMSDHKPETCIIVNRKHDAVSRRITIVVAEGCGRNPSGENPEGQNPSRQNPGGQNPREVGQNLRSENSNGSTCIPMARTGKDS